MHTSRFTRFYALGGAAVTAVVCLAGCDQAGPQMRADTFPMGQPGLFDQPPPKKPLFGAADYLRSHEVLPVAKADIREPLPPLAALPVQNIEVIQPQASTAQASAEQGGVTPAAGMAAAITNAQGDGEQHKLDGSSAK